MLRLLEAEASLGVRPTLLAGDFNTGQWGVDLECSRVPCSQSLVRLSRRGWIDAFRALRGDRGERSWWGRTAAFRFDHAFVSQALEGQIGLADCVTRTTSAKLVAPPGDCPDGRKAKVLSDHAPLVIELNT